MGVPVAYVTGLQMRRAAELYAGAAKTDPRDAFILADFARRNTDRLTWLDVSDELLVRLRVLNGRDVDLAIDANRVIIGQRLSKPGVRDVLAQFPTPTELKAAGGTKIRNMIKRRSPRLANRVTDEIWAALEAQTLVLPAEATWG